MTGSIVRYSTTLIPYYYTNLVNISKQYLLIDILSTLTRYRATTGYHRLLMIRNHKLILTCGKLVREAAGR